MEKGEFFFLRALRGTIEDSLYIRLLVYLFYLRYWKTGTFKIAESAIYVKVFRFLGCIEPGINNGLS